MGCIYNNWNTGICDLFDENFENSGHDENGHCTCEDDDDPTIMCETYTNNEN